MKYLAGPFGSILALLILLAPVRAEAPFVTLVGYGQAEYRFDYTGDRTPVEVALDARDADGLEVAIYTPGQVALNQQGNLEPPVGRGTPGGGHALFWSGRFGAPGVYRVIVRNKTAAVVLYKLSITGESVGGVGQVLDDARSASSNFVGSNVLVVNLPAALSAAPLNLRVPGPPAECTHSYQLDPTLFQSVRLCPNEIYPPLRLVGNGIALYADDRHSAVITSGGRQYAITVDGAGDFIDGVTIQASADAADLGAWLCQYEECTFATQPRPTIVNGGIIYGGGILVQRSGTVIHNVTVHGGTIGIATVNGSGNYILDNQLNDLNGWGIFNVASKSSYFVGNTFNRENHGCKTPDGMKFLHGCETAGWVCLACSQNIVARNHCESSANCFYLSGERGLASNNNRLVANYCAGATDNCFELTFSKGNIIQDTITSADPNTGAGCNYPFWIGGSEVYFKGNLWQCNVSPEDALSRAIVSTSIPTVLRSLDAPQPYAVPTETTPKPRHWHIFVPE